MAVLDREKFLERVRSHFEGRDDDDSISFMEDVIDTYNDVESRSGESEWKKKYEENDANWRRRYKERFFSPIPDSQVPEMEAYRYEKDNEDVTVEAQSPNDKPMTYDDLFE